MEVGRIANYRCSTRSITDHVLRPGRSGPSFYTASLIFDFAHKAWQEGSALLAVFKAPVYFE
jgi:hypothetical protein